MLSQDADNLYALTVRFTLPRETDWSSIPGLMVERAQNLYKDMPGLISKAFLYDPETREYGGNYVWETREDLDRFLSSEIFRTAEAKFGKPRIMSIHKIAAYLDRGSVHAMSASKPVLNR